MCCNLRLATQQKWMTFLASRDVSGQEGLWESLEIDGRMLFGGVPLICSQYSTGRWQQERQLVGGR